VAPGVLETVRCLVEKKLGGLSVLRSGESFDFSHLSCLKAEDLKTLLVDLGYEEVGQALSGADPQILRAFLARFIPAEALEIRKRISKEVALEVKRGAQRHLMSLSFESIPRDRFFLEIGLSVLIRALHSEDLRWAEAFCQKFSVAEGYQLKRLLQERKIRGGSGEEPIREMILARLGTLGGQGKIHRYWKEDQEMEATVIMGGASYG
jgi:hypothetical protein